MGPEAGGCVRINKGDRGLELLELRFLSDLLPDERFGAERRWLAAVARRLCSPECQTSGGFGPAFVSRGRGDAEARVASIPDVSLRVLRVR